MRRTIIICIGIMIGSIGGTVWYDATYPMVLEIWRSPGFERHRVKDNLDCLTKLREVAPDLYRVGMGFKCYEIGGE